MKRFRRELRKTWRAYKELRVRVGERLEIIRERIRQGGARARERKEMIAQMRNIEPEQGLNRGSADVNGVDNRLQTEMEAWSRQTHQDKTKINVMGRRLVRIRARRCIGRTGRSHQGISSIGEW